MKSFALLGLLAVTNAISIESELAIAASSPGGTVNPCVITCAPVPPAGGNEGVALQFQLCNANTGGQLHVRQDFVPNCTP